MTQSLSHKLFKKIDGRELELDIVITSGNISVALVYTQPQDLPLVLATRSIEIPFTHNPSPVEMKKKSLKALNTLLAQFTNEIVHMYELTDLYDAHQVIHTVNIALGPLWIETENSVVAKTFDTSTQVTKEILDGLFRGETTDIIETSILSIQANGYKVEPQDIVGIETSSLEIEYIRSSLDLEDKDALGECIARHFARDSLEEINYIPFVTATLSSVRSLFGEMDEFSILHFDAEDTTFVIQETLKPLIIEQKIYGRAELKRQLIKEKIAPDYTHARDMIRSFYSKGLEDSLHEKIAYVLGIESRVLTSILTEGREKIPTPAFVFSHGLVARFITQEVFLDLDNPVTAKHVTKDHYQDHIQTIGEFVDPSVEILILITHNDLFKA